MILFNYICEVIIKNMSMYNSNLIEDFKFTFKEVKGSDVSDEIVVDFLNEYIDEDLVEDEDLVKNDSIMNDFYDFMENI